MAATIQSLSNTNILTATATPLLLSSSSSCQSRFICKPIAITINTPNNIFRASSFSLNSLRRRSPLPPSRCQMISSEPETEMGFSDSRVSSFSALKSLTTSPFDRYTREKTSIVVLGVSYHTAPVEMLEKLSIPQTAWGRAITELYGLNHIQEAAVLSTCNRMEIYVLALALHPGVADVIQWIEKTSGVLASDFHPHLYMLRESDAIQHLFEVSAGLDSLVLGEGQILSQVKQVVKSGEGVTGFGKTISNLFKHAIIAGKRVRSETNIASGAVSVSSAAVELAVMKLPEPYIATARILVIGAGKMGKLVIKHLIAKGWTKIIVVNRSEERVAAIRKEFKNVEIIYRPLAEMLTSAGEADVVFTSTASETLLFTKENVEALSPVSPKAERSRLFIDISVPRNVGSCVSDVKNTQVYNVYDLKEIVATNKEDRLRKAMKAQAIIADVSIAFRDWRDSQETVPTIKKLNACFDGIIRPEVEGWLSKLRDDFPKYEKKASEDLIRKIKNKLLHGPMKHLRCDGSDCRTLDEVLENMHVLSRIFNLEADDPIWIQKIRTKAEQKAK
ncbi:hypothetical protein AQUCO_00300012v1 [Aquilegia coerulea]|uniref:Glutamyl-tRNA reductase n=1 Tax=Aquilegia coerulea TaxID=218851 RepID=A0A2G5EWR6_AQUCA|nr:hypothetical protein AQUCO_00300012v1 [Aquilegia coerulea]